MIKSIKRNRGQVIANWVILGFVVSIILFSPIIDGQSSTEKLNSSIKEIKMNASYASGLP